MKNETREILVQDLGAGSKHSQGLKRRISDIAKNSLSPLKYASLYTRIIKNYKAKSIVELGTSLGINTLYLANAENVNVTTFEGAGTVAELAAITFQFADAKNIKLIEGDIEHTLPAFLATTNKIDFAFMDANHRYAPTIKYFDWLVRHTHQKSIIVVDDIHYTEEMEKAWHFMQHHTLVYASADLYRSGILFFDPSLNKQHVVLQF